MRYPCEEGYDYAEGYSVGEEDPGGLGGVGVVFVKRMIGWEGEVHIGRGGGGWVGVIEAEMLRGASFRQSSWLAVKLALQNFRWRSPA